MAKKKEPVKIPEEDSSVDEPVSRVKVGNLSEPKSDKISIGKYLQLHGLMGDI